MLLCALAVFLSSFPESGFIIICAASPFFGLFPRPSLTAGICVLSVAAGFFVRFATGRRSLYSANGGIPFVLLFAAVFMSAFGVGRQSVLPAFATCAMMLGFPLAVNLLRDGKRLEFFASAMNFSVLAVSAVGIVQFVAGLAPSGWTDFSTFPGIGARVTSVFDNPNILASWLGCVFPFTLYSVYEGRGKARASGVFTAVCAALCSALTFSRNGWIGLLTGGLVFLLFVSFKYILLIPGTALGAALFGLIFKDSVGRRLIRFFSLSDSANAYRVKVWHGALQAAKHCLLTGAGAGDAAFKSVYTVYCLSGTETAVHAHSIYLQQLISTGLPGLVFLVCFFAVMIRTAVGAFGRAGKGDSLLILGAAGFAGAAAMMVTGLFDNVFYSYRTLFTFWTVCGAALSAFAAGCSGDGGLPGSPSEPF